MISDLIKELLECGVHFGHQTSRWNPKMGKFIFDEKNGIYIIDLRKTEELLLKAVNYIRKIVSEGRKVLFVGTKRQAQKIIEKEARRCGMYYVNQRWLGGTLTNFDTIRRSVDRFKELKKMEKDGTMGILSKKEKSQLTKEMQRLRKNLEGIEDMEEPPDVLFIVDPEIEEIAVKEAKKLSIPVIAVADTDSNPDIIDYLIPANDDAIKAIRVVIRMVADSILEGKKKQIKKEKISEKKEKELSKDLEETFQEIEEKEHKEIDREFEKTKKKKPKDSKEE